MELPTLTHAQIDSCSVGKALDRERFGSRVECGAIIAVNPTLDGIRIECSINPDHRGQLNSRLTEADSVDTPAPYPAAVAVEVRLPREPGVRASGQVLDHGRQVAAHQV